MHTVLVSEDFVNQQSHMALVDFIMAMAQHAAVVLAGEADGPVLVQEVVLALDVQAGLAEELLEVGALVLLEVGALVLLEVGPVLVLADVSVQVVEDGPVLVLKVVLDRDAWVLMELCLVGMLLLMGVVLYMALMDLALLIIMQHLALTVF
ncbi:MAG: hypothetical protein ACRCSI_08135 [Eubacterium aggregans]